MDINLIYGGKIATYLGPLSFYHYGHTVTSIKVDKNLAKGESANVCNAFNFK